DQHTIHYQPARAWLGPVTFTYTVSDGATPSQATVTLQVNPTPNNQPPQMLSVIGDQQMAEDSTLDIPFLVTDDFSPPDYLTYVPSCSDQNLIPNANLSVTGTGENRILHVKGGVHSVGSGSITLTITDEDQVSTPVTFNIVINPLTVPSLKISSDSLQ